VTDTRSADVDEHHELARVSRVDYPQSPPRIAATGWGQAMKAAMPRWITADQPDPRRMLTSTAIANQYMADVNHRLGSATVRRYTVNRDLAGVSDHMSSQA
jgi:hypothetical protein